MLMTSSEVPALFDFSIDGDSAVDPDNMTLWFSQPDLGLPSKGKPYHWRTPCSR
jgi:predicted metalloendopeptidase